MMLVLKFSRFDTFSKKCITHFCRGLVTQAQIDEYQENGVVCLRGVFEKRWLQLASGGVKKNIASPSVNHEKNLDEGRKMYFNDFYNYERFKEFSDIVRYSPSAEIAGRLMQSSLSVFIQDEAISQDEGWAGFSQWHQDQPYHHADGNQVCSLWMPCTPTYRCVQFIRGSHKLPMLDPTTYKGKQENIKPNESNALLSLVRDTPKEDILSYDVMPGDCLVFHMRTVHNVDISVLRNERVVLVSRWAGNDAKIAKRQWETFPPWNSAQVSRLTDVAVGDLWVESKHAVIPWRQKRTKTP